MVKLGLVFNDPSPDQLQRAAQMGVDGGSVTVAGVPGLATNGRPNADGLRRLARRFDDLGLQLHAIEQIRPLIRGVLQGRREQGDRELRNLAETLRIVGDVGIEMVTNGFSVAHAVEEPPEWPGYAHDPVGTAGATLRTFDAARIRTQDRITWGVDGGPARMILAPAAEVRRRLDRFMDAMLPVANEAGVRIAFHPEDPPLPEYLGVEQELSSNEGLAAMLERHDDPRAGLAYCLGTMQEAGADLDAGLRRFAAAGKLFYIHFRNVRGDVSAFQEVLPHEGAFDARALMRTLHEVGYDGYVTPDHYPGLTGDTPTQDVVKAWSAGYMRALIQATATG